ncbi:hypothetical protein TRIUR3_23901 [Triticum urartu]|uniref:Uncharacterized protein n=2 Tax=Triticum urartu TaxID=4572 RepID=M7YZF6_TRIUA|nr:hypothetical protein TRIUR3_23901 [Triticum urartu]
MALSFRICGPLPQQPLWLRHRARGGLLVSHGDYPPDHQGVLLCCRSVASAATKRSVLAWPQYSPAVRTGCHREPSFPKDLLQLFVRAQGRTFCFAPYLIEAGNQPKNVLTFYKACNILTGDPCPKAMLECLRFLLATDVEIYRRRCNARHLSKAVLSVGKKSHELVLGLDVLEKWLRVTELLLQKAPEDVRAELCSKLSHHGNGKTSLERIRDDGGCADEVRELAKCVLTKLRSPK